MPPSAIDQLKQKMGVPSTLRGFFAGTLQAYQQSLSSEPVLVVTRAACRLHCFWEFVTKA